MRKLVVVVLVLAVIAAGVWWFAGRDGGPPGAGGIAADAPLDFAPADTPYVFANLDTLPAAERQRWIGQMDAISGMWRMQLDSLRARLGEDVEDPAAKRIDAWLSALEAEFAGKTLEQSITDIGASMEAHGALYGIGLAPVMRTELADPQKLRDAVARVAQRAGETLDTAKLGDVDYWYVDIPDTTLRAIVALHGKHLVVTVGPATDEAALRTLLGLERPASSLRDSGALQALNAKFGYKAIGSGYVDTARIADLLTSPATPLETALLASFGATKLAADPSCKADAALLAALVPRLSAGYTRIDGGHMDATTHIETLPKIATDLQSLRTPMPGPKIADGTLFDMGFGLKVGALPAVLNGWADIAAKHTFTCPQLVDLNLAATELRSAGSNAGIYAVAPVFNAARFLLTRADFESFQSETPDASGKVLISSGNPVALLAMARNFAPELAAANLQPDGKVVPLPTLAASPIPLQAFAAMSKDVLAIGVGADQEATLGDDLALDPTYQPILVYGVDGTFYSQIMKFGMAQAALVATSDAEREEAQRMGTMMEEMYAKMIKRIDVTVDVDQHGLVIEQKMLVP